MPDLVSRPVTGSGTSARRLAGAAHRLLLVGLLLLLVGAPGCRRFTKQGADAEVYGILAGDRPCVPEVAGSLDVDGARVPATDTRKAPPSRLTLREALDVATRASREYRRAREDVYLAALSQTSAANEFRPQFAWPLSGSVGFTEDGPTVGVTQAPSVSKAFQTGGSIVLGLATSVLRGLTSGSPLEIAQSILSSSVVLPLARGSGRLVAREVLTQAEHETVYALRDYALFQQGFTVDLAAAFWNVLEARATVENEELSYRSLTELLERQKALGAEGAGRVPDFEVDQARQDLLRADQRRLAAQAAYERLLDEFKLDLGIPPEAPLTLVDDVLKSLEGDDPPPPAPTATAAIAVARERRLDLRNAVDRLADARRQVLVAENGLLPDVDLRLGGSVDTPDRQAWNLRRPRPDGFLGLDVDLPLERTAERNAYRAAMIRADRAQRDLEALEDRIEAEIRQAWRRLQLAAQSRDIQGEGAELAEKRVESTTLLLEAGRADTRDRLDAEESRVQARNSYVRAIVELAVARLDLLRGMGILLVDGSGLWAADAPGAPRLPPAPPPPSTVHPATVHPATVHHSMVPPAAVPATVPATGSSPASVRPPVPPPPPPPAPPPPGPPAASPPPNLPPTPR